MLMGTAKQTSTALGAQPVHRGLFAFLRERLARRQDSEHQAALIRIAIAVVVSCYVLVAARSDGIISTEEWHVIMLIPIFIPFAIGVLASIIIYPQSSVKRRILSMVADLATTTYILYFFGEAGIPVYGMYLFNACGNGFRFGAHYLYLSGILGICGFSYIIVASDYWATHRTLGMSLLIVMIVIPVYFANLVRQLHDALARMKAMATHDNLTGLPNRHSFYEQLLHIFKLAERTQLSFAVVFIDLDGFKPINDTFGHAAGDVVLQSIAKRLKESVRMHDVVARFGGDEFVIILSDILTTTVPAVIQKLIDAISEPLILDGKTVFLTSSIGVANYPDSGRTVGELIARADAAMYRAKHKGRNCFCLNEGMHTGNVFSACVDERRAS